MNENPKHNLQKLPLDVQSFEIMREDDYLYIDKTRHLHHMMTQGRYYFLSRPRRFGKTLMTSTLQCIFEGREELFKGLWIAEESDWQWQEYPIISISFNELFSDSPDHLEQSLLMRLERIAGKYGLELRTPFASLQFQELILGLAELTGMPVAILIDEYDKPIIDHLGKGQKGIETAKANRDVLKSFLGVLKGLNVSPHIRFVFLTGISRFSQVSIFSELNNLRDMSMLEIYADVLGYTQEELHTNFQPYIMQFAEKFQCSRDDVAQRLALQYNGYRFSPRNLRVYNPFSILNACNNLDFRDYWFKTATPTFLVNVLKEQHYALPTIEGLQVSEAIFTTFEIERLQPEALLFQTGYLTITDVKGRLYTLDYPNREVKNAFIESLLFALTEEASGRISSHVLRLAEHLESGDLDTFMSTMRSIFAAIPYTLNSNRDEAYFHTIFYLAMSAAGAETEIEPMTEQGRIDLVVKFSDTIYIIEFKCKQNADAAIQQIRKMEYATKYLADGNDIVLMGINFDPETRNILEWKTAPCQPE